MRCPHSLLLSGLFFASSACVLGQIAPPTPAAQASQRLINIVVVGVTDYTATKYLPSANAAREDTIGGQIEQRCNEIQAFFTKTYGSQAKIHALCKKQETTKTAINEFFIRDFPSDAANTLSVVFFMSHGEEVQGTPQSIISPDLHIIASDTKDDDVDINSISVTRDVMSWLSSPPPGSTIIVFIDTCHAGSFQNIQVKRFGDLASEYGLYLNIMASSLPNQNSFAASFTKAILQIWGAKELCLNDAGLATRIKHIIQDNSAVKLNTFEGLPITIVRYQGSGCLFAPANDDRIILIYGAPIPNPVTYTVRSTGPIHEVRDGDLIGKSYEYVRLPKGEYDVTIMEESSTPFTKHVDLRTSLSRIVFVREHPGSITEGRAYSLAADAAVKIGHQPNEVADLRKRAASIYQANGALFEAQSELAKIEPDTEMVWVDTDSGIYHRGGRWYGRTKHGKLMTKGDAVKAGYKPARPDLGNEPK